MGYLFHLSFLWLAKFYFLSLPIKNNLCNKVAHGNQKIFNIIYERNNV